MALCKNHGDVARWSVVGIEAVAGLVVEIGDVGGVGHRLVELDHGIIGQVEVETGESFAELGHALVAKEAGEEDIAHELAARDGVAVGIDATEVFVSCEDGTIVGEADAFDAETVEVGAAAGELHPIEVGTVGEVESGDAVVALDGESLHGEKREIAEFEDGEGVGQDTFQDGCAFGQFDAP